MSKNPTISFISFYDYESYSIRLLSEILKKECVNAKQIYFKKLYTDTFPFQKKELDSLIDTLKQLKTDIVGMSVRSPSMSTAAQCSRRIKEALDIPIIMGGTHPSVCPEESLEYADYICVGEAENIILDFIRSYNNGFKDIDNIKGIWSKKSGRAVNNGVTPFVEDLNILPFELYSQNDKYFIEDGQIFLGDPLINNSVVEVFASRGCPFKCTYCTNNILREVYGTHKKYIRRKSVDYLMDELKYLKTAFKNSKKMVFADDVFTFDRKWVSEFAERYVKDIRLPFGVLFYPTLVFGDVLDILKKAGLTHGRFGVQSGSYRVRKDLYDRQVSDQDIINAAATINSKKIRVTMDLIVDSPYDTEQDKIDSLDLFLNVKRPFELNLHSLVYFPRTELTKRALKDGIITEKGIEGINSSRALRLAHVLDKNKHNKSDLFWDALYSLASKEFIPKSLIRFLSKNNYCRKHVSIVLYIALISNLIKQMLIALYLLMHGEISFADIWEAMKTVRSAVKVGK